jgi:hypothetical protein
LETWSQLTSLTLPNELARYTIHSITNGVESSYNSWDSLTVLGENGTIGINPLIIESKNAGQGIAKVLQ